MKKKKWIIFLTVFLLLGASLAMILGAFHVSSSDGSGGDAVSSFSDVDISDWFFSDVVYVKEKNIMNGTGDTTFSPDMPTTRGMLVTILWRLEGEPDSAGENAFADVKKDGYYRDAVVWAAENKIVSGYSGMAFGPEDSITREQLATVFYRYAAYKKYDVFGKTELDQYEDAAQISDYALESMQWANAGGIIMGTYEGNLEPQGTATRCQVAAILHRFIEAYSTEAADEEPESPAATAEPSEKPIGEKRPAVSYGNTASGRNKAEADTDAEKSPAGGEDNPEKGTEDTNSRFPGLKVHSASGTPGKEVQVLVSVENNPGILGMILSIGYDENVLQLESVENGEAVSDVLTLTPSKTLSSGAKFVWDGLELAPEDIRDGTVLVMNFKISDTANTGKYSINFGYAEGDIIDNTLSSISPQLEQGYITVEVEKE